MCSSEKFRKRQIDGNLRDVSDPIPIADCMRMRVCRFGSSIAGAKTVPIAQRGTIYIALDVLGRKRTRLGPRLDRYVRSTGKDLTSATSQ